MRKLVYEAAEIVKGEIRGPMRKPISRASDTDWSRKSNLFQQVWRVQRGMCRIEHLVMFYVERVCSMDVAKRSILRG